MTVSWIVNSRMY